MNKEKLKSLLQWLALGVLGAASVGSAVYAFAGSNSGVVCEAGSGCVINVSGQGSMKLGSEAGPSDDNIGSGVPNRVPHGYLDTSDGFYVDGVEVIGPSGTSRTLTINATSTVGNLTIKGAVLSTTTIASETLNENDLLLYNYWSFNPNTVADINLTLPASSTLTTLIPNTGDTKRIIIDNVTSSPSTEIVLVAGTGTFLYSNTSTFKTFASTTSYIQCTRRANTDIGCTFDAHLLP